MEHDFSQQGTGNFTPGQHNGNWTVEITGVRTRWTSTLPFREPASMILLNPGIAALALRRRQNKLQNPVRPSFRAYELERGR